MTDISTSAIAAVADRGAVLEPTAELREPEDRAIAELMPQLVWAALPHGGHDYYNGRWYEYTGMPRDGSRGLDWEGLVHPGDRARAEAGWRHALETGEPYEAECRLRRADGSYRWFVGRAVPMRAATGQIRRWIGTWTDIDDAKRAEGRARVLAEAAAALVETLDTDAALAAVARLAVPRLADWCAVDLLGDDGALRRVAIHHADPAMVATARRLAERYPEPPDAEQGARRAVRTGATQLLADVPDALLERAALDREHLAALRALGPRSVIVVPVHHVDGGGRADARVLGAITLVSAEANRRFGAEDVETAEELARRVGAAIERTRLYGEAVAARERIAQQAAELEAQNEELQQQAAELEMQMEQLQQQATELEMQTEQMQQQAMELEMQTEQLHQQATELEMQNEQLQEQTAELEVQATQLLEQSAELERSNVELARARADMVRVFERAPVAICVLRGADMVFELANPLYLELIGRTSAVGRPLREVIPELEPGLLATVDGARRTGERLVAAEYRIPLRAAGREAPEERYFNLVVQPIEGRGGEEGRLVVVAAEVTALVRARQEAERMASAAEEARVRAEEANAAKGHFLATMSHELRTPLNAVNGYADLLALGVRGPVNEAQLDDLERIKRSGQHLLAVINDILHFAKLEAGQIEFDVTDVPLAPALAEVEALIAPQLAAKGLSYEFVEREGPGEGAVVARADRERCQQVVLNLLTNAVKFTPAGGRVTVSCGEAGERVFVRVRDTGIGIPADKVATVFDPFVQVSRKLNRPSEGVGLGLAISRDLARGMGGDLTAESVPGEGSTFTLFLPRAGA